MRVQISAGRALKERTVYTIGSGLVFNVWGSVQDGGVYTGGAKFFKFLFKIDQLEMTRSHMFSTSLRLTNHK